MTKERPALPPALVLVVAVAAMSWAGPLVKFATAPPQVISAWRLVFSVAFIAIVLLVRGIRLWRVSRGKVVIIPLYNKQLWLLALLAGVMLAAHFWAWLASLRYTTVASSVVLVDMQPIFVAVLSGLFLHERATLTQWTGIVIACAGAVVIAVGDAGSGDAFSGSALFGDMLALLGAGFVSVYYIIGRKLRQSLDLWVYIGVVYGIAALVLVGVVAADPSTDLTGYPTSDWLIFLALAAGPMMLGHTGINYALRYVPAFVANIAILGEPIGATIIAWLLPQLREVPSWATLTGALLIGAGIVLGAARPRPAQTKG